MTLSAASVNIGGTSSVTGGTATSYVSKGNTLNQHMLMLDEGAEFLAQRTIDCSIKEPKVSVAAPNGYTQARCAVLVKAPLALDNGKFTVNTVRVEIATDIETTDAEKLELREWAAQLLYDSDYTAFWDDQSLT